MTTETAARVFHRDQLAVWGVPFDLPTDPETAPEGAAIELHEEQIESRRWVAVYELVFRAPDDGKAYRVTYERGLTEVQEDHDEWDYRDHVVGELVEQYDRTVKAWRPVKEQRAAEEQPFVPRTEREYWQAIADALNAAEQAGMSVGIDLDGTLTDHNAWSVVWDRAADRWDVTGYEDDDQAPAAPEQPRTPAVGDRYVKRDAPDADRIVTVTRVWTAEDGHTAVAYEWRDDKPGQCGSACPLDVFHRTYEAQQ